MTGVQTCALPICFPVTISGLCDDFKCVGKFIPHLYEMPYCGDFDLTVVDGCKRTFFFVEVKHKDKMTHAQSWSLSRRIYDGDLSDVGLCVVMIRSGVSV